MPNVFNSFFSSVSSSFSSETEDCKEFIDRTFTRLKRDKKLTTPGFSFKMFDSFNIGKVINKLSKSSSPVVTGIPTQILKDISHFRNL